MGTKLHLEQVQALARAHNPTFAEFEASRAAARAEVLQALAYPNPELDLSVTASKSREAPIVTALEYGLGLVQPIEIPAKRKARRKAAEAAGPVVDREEDVFRSTLRADVARAYATVLYYEHAVQLAQETLQTEREIEKVVKRRVEGGESPQIDQVKAEVESLKAARLVQAQQRQLATARAVLNAYCGRSLPRDFALVDTLEGSQPKANMEEARRIALAYHPALSRTQALIRQRKLAIGREQKAWYPDLKPSLGFDREVDAKTLGAGLGLELPFWNRNKGGIAAAQAELMRAEAEQERTRQEILRDLETGAESYESAREQITAFRSGLRSAAAESLELGTFLYEQGEADLLQLLDARRTARQTEAEYLQALYDAQISRAELEKAIGIGGMKE